MTLVRAAHELTGAGSTPQHRSPERQADDGSSSPAENPTTGKKRGAKGQQGIESFFKRSKA